MSIQSYVFRDFSRIDKNTNFPCGSIGDIKLSIQKNNYIFVSITGLHGCFGCIDPDCESMGEQAYLFIKIAPNLELYDVIKIILFKLTCDLTYRTDFDRIEPYRDFIITHSTNIENSDAWNFDTKLTAAHGIWMPLTEEAICDGYLTINDNHNPDNFDCIIHRGEVCSNYEFVYDAPIVDMGQTKEYYDKTRSKQQSIKFPPPFLRKNEFTSAEILL